MCQSIEYIIITLVFNEQDIQFNPNETQLPSEVERQILGVCEHAQETLNEQIPIEQLKIVQGTHGRDWAASRPLRYGDKEAFGFLFVPSDFDIESQTPLELDELFVMGHEVGHIVAHTEIVKMQTVNPALNDLYLVTIEEGVAELTGLFELGKQLGQLPDLTAIAHHYKEQIAPHLETYRQLIRDNADPYSTEFPSVSQPQLLDSDFLRDNRHLYHGVGMAFVLDVIPAENPASWHVICDNPPTIDELLYPQLYKQRLGETLTTYTSEKIEPKTIEINKDKRLI